QHRDGSLSSSTGRTFASVAHHRAIRLIPSASLRCKFVEPLIEKYGFALDQVRHGPVQLLECLDSDYRSGQPFRRRRYAIPKCCDVDSLLGVDYLPRIAHQVSLFSSSDPVPDSEWLEPHF